MVGFQSYFVDHACGHRHGGNAGGANKRVNISTSQAVHGLAHENAGGRAYRKR